MSSGGVHGERLMPGYNAETESEEESMSQEAYEKSCEWTIFKVKEVNPVNAKKPKVDGEMVKRLVVGFAAMAWMLIPMYIHPFLLGPVAIITTCIIHSETFNIHRKPFEQSDNFAFRFSFLFFAYLYTLPRIGILERTIMENSGFTAE